MAIVFDPYNYKMLAHELTHKKQNKNSDEAQSPAQYIDGRMAEINKMAASPAHRIIGVLLEIELNQKLVYSLSTFDSASFENHFYLLKTYNPFHRPIASSLTHDQIQDLRNAKPGSEHAKQWNESQAWFLDEYLGKIKEFMTITDASVTLKTGLESADYYISNHSASIGTYFYTVNALPEAFPEAIAKLSRHAMGIEQVRNSPTYKTIRKQLVGKIQSGDLPVELDIEKHFEENLKGMLGWMKPRDVKFANAYSFGKRSIEWLEQFASASSVLERLTEGLGERQINQKWANSFSTLVLNLCDHLKSSDHQLASDAFYKLVAGIGTSKILSAKGADQMIERIKEMTHEFTPSGDLSAKGVLTLRIIEHRDGFLDTPSLLTLLDDKKQVKAAREILEAVYPEVTERTRVMNALGIKTNTRAMNKEKGKALMDELGL